MSRVTRYCIVLVFCCSLVVLRGSETVSNDYISSLKQFLNTNYDEYEVVFSVVQHNNPALQKMLEEHNKTAKKKLMLQFETPGFLRVRRTQDGFFVHVASSLKQITNCDVSTNGNHAQGVVSNSYWSANNGLLVMDNSFLPNLYQQQGRTWKDLANEAADEVLSLGMWINKGTVVWDGTNFTAETRTRAPVPKDKQGQRIISGYITLSNGVPSEIAYQFASNRFTIVPTYEGSISKTYGIPSQFTIFSRFFGGGNNTVSYQISSLLITNFPPDSTAPMAFANTNNNPRLTIIHKTLNGAGIMSQFNGKTLTNLVGTTFGAVPMRKGTWVLLALLFFTGLMFFGLSRERKRQK